MTIRIPLGIGDAVYCYPIVKHFTKQQSVQVITPYPELFESLKNVQTLFTTSSITMRLQYRSKCRNRSQYQELLDCAGLSYLPFVFEWEKGFTEDFKKHELAKFTNRLVTEKKELCVIKEPCAAHIHKPYGDFSVTPNIDEMQKWIDDNKEQFFFVSVGQHEIFKTRLSGIDYDLNDQTSVQDLITLCAMSKMIVTQVGHLLPIAQGLGISFKLFYPENPTDPRLKNLDSKRLGVDR